MAKSSKKKAGKSKAKLTLGIVVAIMAIFVAGYFVYFTGILPQLLPGMTITETKDGANQKVATLSVIETNYYYMNIYSMYAQYGMVTKDNIDTVLNQETGQTYRDLLFSQGADEALSLILMEREADSKGFRDLSAAKRAAKLELESLRGIATLYGASTVDKYLEAQYGTGMTSRLYKKCLERSLYGDEYTQYLSQFDANVAPTDEAIKEQYKANPGSFEKATFHYYLVTAQTKDGKADIEGAKKDAQWIADKAKDEKSFRDTCQLYLKGKGDTEALKEYENDADPTLVEPLSKTNVESYYDAKLSEFLFAADRKEGDKTVIETATGAYVVFFVKRSLDETKEVTYRTMTLNNDAKQGAKERTDEQVAADAKALEEKVKQLAPQGLDPLSFYKLVKANSDDQDEMMSGGYVAGTTKSDMIETEDGKEADAATKAVAEWLFDESRKQGDVYYFTSADKRTVTVYYYEKSSASWINDARNTQATENVNKLKESLKATNPQYVINSDLVKKLIY